MNMKFSTTIKSWGSEALDFLPPNDTEDNNFIMIINENAPEELLDVAVLHPASPVLADPAVGDTVMICGKKFTISSIGFEAVHTLRTLGHCVLNFKGGPTPDMPGCIMLEGDQLTVDDVKVGGKIEIF